MARPARIGINAVFLDPARTGGAETYTRQLISGLQQLTVRERFFIFAPLNHGIEICNSSFELVECPVDASRRYRRILWEQVRLPRVMQQYQLDLAHFPYGTLPSGYRDPAVVTVHDTIRFLLRGEKSLFQRAYRGWIERRIGKSRAHVIAVSKFDAGSIARHLGIPSERLSSVYHGVAGSFFEPPNADTSPPRSTLMWVGRPYGRKNLDTLIRAYAILRRRRADAPALRIVGVEPEHRPGLEALLQAAGVTGGVSLEPPAMHNTLPELLQTAKVFVDPSRYESFGLPVLEAMAAGTPVVCADIPAYRELHARRALFADPDAPHRFAAEIERLLTNPALWSRMSHDGIRHAARFTWDSCVRNTYDIYRKLLGSAADPDLSGEAGVDRNSAAIRQPAAA